MNGGRVGEVVLHVGGNAVASEGVLRHVHPLGDSPRRCLADGGACVPRVLPAAELEGVFFLESLPGQDPRVCVFITGEGESQNKGKQIWSYEERR